jgi:alkylhydroperoxidase family enzyme
MTPVDRQLAPPRGWHAYGAPKIEPFDTKRLSPLMRLAHRIAGKYAQRRVGMAKVPDVFLLLMRNRRLFQPWLRFAARLMPGGTLERKDSELVILRVGWNCRSRYEWGQHVIIGQREGLTPQDIARVAQGPDAPGWGPRQSALLQAADDLHANRVIAAQTWTRLGEHFDDAQLIEVGMLVGHYEMLAGVLNSVGLALEPPAEERLAAAEIHGRA